MECRQISALSCLLLALNPLTANVQELKANLPNVAIIITGGTISSRLDPKSGGAIPTTKEAILEIATSAEVAERMREKGLARANKFDWSSCAQKVSVVYEEVLSRA